MKKTLLICFGLIIFIPLTSTAIDIVQKVGVLLASNFTAQGTRNLSFGVWAPLSDDSIRVIVSRDNVAGDRYMTGGESVSPIEAGHPGIIKITGYGTISIKSTPPTELTCVRDGSVRLPLSDMKIIDVREDNVTNSRVEIRNGEVELKTVGTLFIPESSRVVPGECKADWPITIVYEP